MKISHKFYIILLLFAVSCSRKAVPSIPSVSNPCDDIIQELLDSVQNVEPTYIYDVLPGETDTICIIDSSNCNYYKIAALEMAGKYNATIKEREFYKALAQSRAKKIVNNINVNSKNKDTQIGDANVSQQKNKGPAVNGEGNVTTVKPKQSAIGDGNKLDNSKKGIGWFWIFIGGYMFCHLLHKIVIPALMGTNPFTAAISKIKTITGIFRS